MTSYENVLLRNSNNRLSINKSYFLKLKLINLSNYELLKTVIRIIIINRENNLLEIMNNYYSNTIMKGI